MMCLGVISCLPSFIEHHSVLSYGFLGSYKSRKTGPTPFRRSGAGSDRTVKASLFRGRGMQETEPLTSNVSMLQVELKLYQSTRDSSDSFVEKVNG